MADDADQLLIPNVTIGIEYNSSFTGSISLFNATTTTFGDPNGSDVTTAVYERPTSGYTVWQQALIGIVLAVLMIGTAIGNSLVCIAVGIVKRLQTPSNLLIVSLAVSDLLVALLVMPFSAVKVLMGYWPFSDTICDLWTSSDVIMCTASILNLCMISVDRYFVITRPFQYAMKRTPRRMFMMIGAVWTLAIVISVPPLFIGTSDTDRVADDCVINQSIAYQIYATLGSFYVPLIMMIFIYYRIWKISNEIMKKESKSGKLGSIDRGTEHINLSRSSGASDHLSIPNGNCKNGFSEAEEMLKPRRLSSRYNIKSILCRNNKKGAQQRGSNGSGGQGHGTGRQHSSNKERKAIKTLGIIMGGFTLCWLPFFIVAVSAPFLPEGSVPIELNICFTWLGYFNSFMNPLIYARFNREFRSPFKEILCFRCRNINNRLRSESYVEQYGPDQVYRDRDRDALRPPADTIVRYHSQDQTQVHIGNGSRRSVGESNL